MRINIINIALNYKHTLYTEIAYTNCLVSNLNIYIRKTLVPNFSVLFAYPSINKRLYYNSGLFLNKNINLTSIGL